MENVTVENFIEDYLIKQIGEVKACHPYFAFALIAIGIEFLGKCQNSYTDWNYYKHSQPEKDFNLGLSIPPLNKYSNMGLFQNLRNGMAHSFLTKGKLLLSNTHNSESNCLDLDEFYANFAEACRKVLDGEIQLPVKNLSDTFFNVKEVVNTNGLRYSISGDTK